MATVYLISDGEGMYKIGYTTRSVNKRLNELQIGSPRELSVAKTYDTINARKIEASLHRRYRWANTNGEWFELPIDAVVNFESMCESIDQGIQALKDMGNPFI